MADAAEDAGRCIGEGRQDVAQHGLGLAQVGVADEASNLGAAPAITAGPGDAGHELCLAHAAQVLRPVGAVVGAAFDEDGLADVVAGAGVGPQLAQQVAAPVATRFPQVMVRVDDGAFGVDGFFPYLVQPGLRSGGGVCHRVCSRVRACAVTRR